MRNCTTEKTAENQRKLCAALLALAEKTPYEQIFVSDVCQLAGISRRSFYRYFSNKDEVLYALIKGCVMECAVQSMELRIDIVHLNALLERFFLFWKERRGLLNILRKNRIENLLMDVYLEWTFQELQSYPNKTVSQTTLIFSVTGVMAVLFQWCARNFDDPADLLSRETAQLLQRVIG